MSELNHLSEEQKKQVLEIFPKEIRDLESSDEGASVVAPVKEVNSSPEDDKIKDTKDIPEVDEWKDGYLDYEKKSNDSDRVVYEFNDIEITEEDLD